MRLLSLLLLLSVAAGRTTAADTAKLAELEQQAVRVAGERERAQAERSRLVAEAAPVAERIASSAETGPRAGRELTQRLRELDRLAAQLDDVERRLRALDRRLERTAAAFDREAELEERSLLGHERREGPGSASSGLAALAQARRRVSALATPKHFRPPLEVPLGALDGAAEMEAKLQIVDGERARLAERARELAREQALLAARLRGRREWARDLGAARRDAGGEVELVERAHESAEDALHELDARASRLAGEILQLRRWDEALAARRHELEQALRSLETRGATP